jgi:hypothetical protein
MCVKKAIGSVEMKAVFWSMKVTTGVGNKINRCIWMFSKSDQPTQFGNVSHINSSYQQ